MIGSRENAEDVSQKVFLKTFRSLKSLKDPAKFSSWIYGITLNMCRDELRARRRNRLTSLDEMLETRSTEPAFNNADDPVAEIDRANLGGILRKALDTIPEEQSLVIVMKEYQGLKFREIAEILDVPINTVKSRMYYGLAAMGKVLSAMNVDREALLNGL
jgi:RNA polymerase sigma-70 factor (ECF subfamily)